MKKSSRLSITLVMAIAIISVNGCAVDVVYEKPVCHRPADPVIPRLDGAAAKMSCLSDETYTFLVKRDVVRKTYADSLNAVLDQVCAPPAEQ